MRVEMEPQARWRLERLCDAQHPKECGGLLLGTTRNDITEIRDIFPIPNVSDTPHNTYSEHSWGAHWGSIYEKTVSLTRLGTFHSHPDGTIPSAQDMKAYNDHQLHIWVIHHNKMNHTFQASKGIKHLDLKLRAMAVAEQKTLQSVDDRLELGDLWFDRFGRLQGDTKSLKFLSPTLSQKTIQTYHHLLEHQDRWHYITTKELANALDVTPATIRRWLKPLVEKGFVKKSYSGFRVIMNN